MRMKKSSIHHYLAAPRQRGWILLEVILCLSLFAVVLHVVQRQTETQWHLFQQIEQDRQQGDYEQKRAAMTQLVGSAAWLNHPQESIKQGYPDCQKCTGDQLAQWFQTLPSSSASAPLEEQNND
jgi:cell division protein FtsB